jgi:alpha-glucosidase
MVLLLTLRGTPTLYYGDELGMVDGLIAPDRIRDPWGQVEPAQNRDPGRTPMPWDGSPSAGFTAPGVEPWLPLAPGHETVNVAAQRDDPDSMLSLARALLRLRREHPALAAGSYRAIDATPEGTFCYLRIPDEGGPVVLVAFNMVGEPRQVALAHGHGRVIAGTHPDRSGVTLDTAALELRPDEGLVLEVAWAVA